MTTADARAAYRDLIRQGYSREQAARRTGYTPKGAAPPRVLAPPPRPVPTEAQRAWKSGEHRRRRPTLASPAEPSRVDLPAAVPAPLPTPRRRERSAHEPRHTPDQKWRESALCAEVDPEIFFPEKGGSTREAKRICGACDVRQECLSWALETGEYYGILGGLTSRDRQRIRTRGRAHETASGAA